jgi:hypothetical protein
MTKGYLITGAVLFLLYILQDVLNIRWHYLHALQLEEGFKRWSGLCLLFFIILQWSLTISRVKKRLEPYAPFILKLHKWMGAFSPLLFYIHSMKFGFAYLFLLSITFFTNMLLGFVHVDIIKTKAYWYFQGWMIAHVAFSLIITLLSLFHIWIVFYYN